MSEDLSTKTAYFTATITHKFGASHGFSSTDGITV